MSKASTQDLEMMQAFAIKEFKEAVKYISDVSFASKYDRSHTSHAALKTALKSAKTVAKLQKHIIKDAKLNNDLLQYKL